MTDSPTVYLNGDFLPVDQARVSVLDRGFLFGDGVYEVIPIYAGRPFRVQQHLQRLDQSLAGIHLDNPLDHAGWLALFAELIARNGGGDLQLYLQVTRGAAPTRDHAFPREPQPTVLVMSTPQEPPPAELQKQGIHAMSVEDIRWSWCHIKSINLLPNILLRRQAFEAGADEAVMVRDGEVTEGAASNIFALVDGEIRTPPKSHLLLPGVTRDLLLELCREAGLACAEGPLDLDQLRRADEVWISSSTRELVAITHLDGRPIGSGRPGPVWRRCLDLYHARLTRLRAGLD